MFFNSVEVKALVDAFKPSVVPLLRDLEQAAKDGLTVGITYRKANAEQDDGREVDPYGLAYDRNEWYVVAYCHRSQAVRTFRVDRIARLEPLELKRQIQELAYGIAKHYDEDSD